MQIAEYKHIQAVQTALTHSTYANKYDVESNQALETVGDGILDHIIAKWLYQYDITTEKDITNIRSRIVNNKNLAKIGEEMGLKYHILTYRHNPTSKDIADCFEAVIGALALELGSRHVESILRVILDNTVRDAIQDERENPIVEGRSEFNPVNRLQEYAQDRGFSLPKYDDGMFNGETYKVVCHWRGNGQRISSYGVASRKKEARKKAAYFMLQRIGVEV